MDSGGYLTERVWMMPPLKAALYIVFCIPNIEFS